MKIIKVSLICIFTLIYCSCNKENAVPYIGVYFFPIGKINSLLEYKYSGITNDESQISFFRNYEPYEQFPNNILMFDKTKQEVIIQDFPNSNINREIYGVVNIKPNEYLVGFVSDTSIINVGSSQYSREMLGLIDKTGIIRKTFRTHSFSYSGLDGLKLLADGKFLAWYYSNNRTDIYCLDKDLNLIWEKEIELGTGAAVDDAFEKNNAIYLELHAVYTAAKYFKVIKLDQFGNQLAEYKSTPDRSGIFHIIPATVGFKVIGAIYNAAVGDNLMIASFDENCNLISTKLLANHDFENENDIVRLNSIYYGLSNIIHLNNKYYFTLVAQNKSAVNRINKFIRVSEDFEIEKNVVIENSAVSFTSYRYLALCGEHFVTIGSTNWNGMDGISFIETDRDGNIIK